MAVRSLTETFLLMRNNSLQSRHILSEQSTDDHASLVTYHDVEKGFVATKDSRIPPMWLDGLEEAQYEMTKIRQKMKELSTLHDKHLNRPTLDDSAVEEKAIESITQDITRMLSHCQRIVRQIGTGIHGNGQQEDRVTRNVVTSLVSSLQELTANFRSDQSLYLKRLKLREERSQQFFDNPLLVTEENGFVDEPSFSSYVTNQPFNEEQLLLVENNTRAVDQREKEVQHIVQSIVDINQIFRDLATIVSDQGTVLDRIDYNIEHVQSRVQQGLQQLHKAENYHRKNHKMMCILVMAVTSVLLIILLISLKF